MAFPTQYKRGNIFSIFCKPKVKVKDLNKPDYVVQIPNGIEMQGLDESTPLLVSHN